jgi:hypothetical protein
MARFFSRLLRMRWAVALRFARRAARELHDAHDRQELHDAHDRQEPAERARLAALIRRSRGRPHRLSRSEHGEVVRLTRQATGRPA